ncbi:MAG: hypothetical protein NTX24_02320 [Candidatus Pacearchaeota archaeon]|nr:hypothetical protein [Candidatus Pacearchaeota archaeon]
MFEKKIKCICGKKISEKENYCPHCGTPASESSRTQKRMKDEEKAREDMINSVVKDFSKSFGIPKVMQFPFEHLVKQLTKDVEKQFRETDQELMKSSLLGNIDLDKMMRVQKFPKNAKKEDVKIMQDGKPIGDMQTFNFPGGFSVQIKLGGPVQVSEGEKVQPQIKESSFPSSSRRTMTEEEQSKVSKLPREEPITRVRRFTNKIVYEIELPGVNDEKKIFINKLQNSIEIKAFAKDKAYFKLIPVSFLLKSWTFSKGKLVLNLVP